MRTAKARLPYVACYYVALRAHSTFWVAFLTCVFCGAVILDVGEFLRAQGSARDADHTE